MAVSEVAPRLGLIVNPVAGLGGAMARKGSDEPGLVVAARTLTKLEHGQPAVYVVRRGKAGAVPVVVAEANSTQARVIGDLRAGELVILNPPSELRDGRGVTVMSIEGEAEALPSPPQADADA